MHSASSRLPLHAERHDGRNRLYATLSFSRWFLCTNHPIDDFSLQGKLGRCSRPVAPNGNRLSHLLPGHDGQPLVSWIALLLSGHGRIPCGSSSVPQLKAGLLNKVSPTEKTETAELQTRALPGAMRSWAFPRHSGRKTQELSTAPNHESKSGHSKSASNLFALHPEVHVAAAAVLEQACTLTLGFCDCRSHFATQEGARLADFWKEQLRDA